MIKKITISRADKEKIENLKIDPARNNNRDDFDYTGIVINKPWGHEYLAFGNNEVAVWILNIKQHHQTSMHCHPNKRTSIVVLGGEALCSTLNSKNVLSVGKGVLLDKGVFHSTKALSSQGIIVMETETPTNKRDLVRLEDQYGRAHKDYEGEEHYRVIADASGRIGKINQGRQQFTTSLIDSTFESFHNSKERYNRWKKFGECELGIFKHTDRKQFQSQLAASQAETLAMLEGRIFNSENQRLLEAGDVVSLVDFKNQDFSNFDKIEFLLLRNKKNHEARFNYHR